MNASETPTYYAWQPSPESRGTIVSAFLTPGRSKNAPEPNRKFVEAVLESLDVGGSLISWGVESFLTNYFSREWQECWEVRMMFRGNAKVVSGRKLRVSIWAETVPAPHSERFLPLRVLADFSSADAARRSRAELKLQAANAKWNEVHYERFKIRDLGKGYKQLLVDIVTAERERIRDVIPEALKVIETCERLGGRSTVEI